jgi:hypothetical protein
MFHPLALVVAWILERELLLPLLLVHALALERRLPDALVPLVLAHIRVLRLVTPQTVVANWCLSQLVTDLTNDWKKFYFDFHCYPLTAFWMKLDFPKPVT